MHPRCTASAKLWDREISGRLWEKGGGRERSGIIKDGPILHHLIFMFYLCLKMFHCPLWSSTCPEGTPLGPLSSILKVLLLPHALPSHPSLHPHLTLNPKTRYRAHLSGGCKINKEKRKGTRKEEGIGKGGLMARLPLGARAPLRAS